jgi:transglutaminase-like putative cysteine protease
MLNVSAGAPRLPLWRDLDARPIAPARSDVADSVLRAWASQFIRNKGEIDPRRLLADMARFIRATMQHHTYPGAAEQTPLTTLMLQSGAEIDFATLMVESIRSLGYSACVVPTPHPGVQVDMPGQGRFHFDLSSA